MLRVCIAVVLACLGGCDALIGIGDPYQDARPIADTTTPDAIEASIIASFTFEDDFINHVDGNPANCVAGNCPLFAPGKHGKAIDLNGSNQCLTFSSPQPAAFSISVWAFDRTDTAYSIVAKPENPTAGHDTWQIDTDTNATIRFLTYDGANDQPVLKNMAIQPSTWEHIAVTFDGNTKKLFINGVVVAFANQPNVMYDTSNALIGCDQDASFGHFYSGMIDDLIIWKRALTEAEVMAIFNAG